MFSLGPRTAVSALGSEEKDTGSGTVSSSGGTGGDNENIPGKHRKHHFFRQIGLLVLGVMLMEINSNVFSNYTFKQGVQNKVYS